MQIDLLVDGEEELRSLTTWLRAEPDVQQNAVISLESQPEKSGAMGNMQAWVQLIVDTSLQAGNLVLAVAAWRKSRPDSPTVTVRYRDVEAMINNGDPETVARVVRALERQ